MNDALHPAGSRQCAAGSRPPYRRRLNDIPPNDIPQSEVPNSQFPIPNSKSPIPSSRRGLVLILVLVVIAMLTLAALAFCELMLVERRAAVSAAHQAQSRASADSGLDMVRLFVGQTQDFQDQAGGWYDNPPRFRGKVVFDDPQPQRRSRFTIIAPRWDQANQPGIRFGLQDESTRLNLNTLALADKYAPNGARLVLLGLPGMTEEIADSILDWIDADDQPREFGAEVDYYSGQTPSYAPKNGPLETVEELLLVRGVTPGLLFGTDANRNGLPDSDEPGPESLADVDNSDGSMTSGWAAYLTLWSMESNLRPDGTPRVNLNQSDMQKLYDELKEALGNDTWATYIVALRQNGEYTGAQTLKPATDGQLNLTQKAKKSFTTVLDVIGPQVQVTFVGEKEPVLLNCPFPYAPGAAGVMNAYLPTLMDNLTTQTSKTLPGRININQAPRAVLAGIPGMTPEMVDKIISQREPDPSKAQPERRHETWLLSEGIVTLEEMKALMPFVCGGGSVYRAEVVGYFDQGGPAVRLEAVIDATKKPPKVVFWRDLSHLGRGYPLEILGIEALPW